MLAKDFDLVSISASDVIFSVAHSNRYEAGGPDRATGRSPANLLADDIVEEDHQSPTGSARLELRVHSRWVPAESSPGGILFGELRYQRGDSDRRA